jgi:hypothetical protein
LLLRICRLLRQLIAGSHSNGGYPQSSHFNADARKSALSEAADELSVQLLLSDEFEDL